MGSEVVSMPDIDGSGEVVELCADLGAEIKIGQSLLVIESDKASMEVPSNVEGVLEEWLLDVGSTVESGTLLCAVLEQGVAGKNDYQEIAREAKEETETEALKLDAGCIEISSDNRSSNEPVKSEQFAKSAVSSQVYSGPAARKLARELGVNLEGISGTGPRGRILKEDIKAFVKQERVQKTAMPQSSGIPQIPDQDFSRFGAVDVKDMSNIARATSEHMTRCWLNIPHATLFDEADITELESFRKGLKPESVNLEKAPTILPFIVKVIAQALRKYPLFNSSLSSDGKQVIYKNYVNIGVAVDTPAGLVVPVIKGADSKSISELTVEINDLAVKARERQLKPADMQGGCFTISSLGPTGGTGFTPIVNAPEVAILGVAKASIKPVWDGRDFQPRKQLPLSLSFDHRVINGGDAGRFMAYINSAITDIRQLLL
ncbi:2-oxo acid dehydrogenase subunit E2 [Neptuniibacter sp. QD48_55]|uniref:2-oxo acid dehydrogenase subunit E2 n=1 Tax=Neptuniibacter sp. QD48_55 TaxID=3398212 RepID=UPI0039F4956E